MLEGRNISFVRENKILFNGLSFCLRPGETLAIKGANGSGKSTLLRLLTGLLPLKVDQLFWYRELVSKANLAQYQHNLLYVGHKLCLHPEVLVEDQLHLWHNLYKIPKNSLEHALEKWGLRMFKHKKISHLSQGQQKRLALSRCSWLKRSLWILDEPEAGLDQEGQRHLADTLLTHGKEGGMLIQATHHSASTTLEILL